MDHYFSDLSKIYQKISVIKESPDTIVYRGTKYEYDNPSLGNYSGIFNNHGKFAMTNLYQGHADFVRNSLKGILNGVKTNCKDKKELIDMARDATDYEYFRIWPKFNVISFWSKHTPDLVEAAIEAIKSIKKDPTVFLYDFSDSLVGDTADMMSYDEFVSNSNADSDYDSRRMDLMKQKREFANWMLKKSDGD